MRELTRTVGAEIVEDRAVTVLHAGIALDNKRDDELIRHALRLLARIGIGSEHAVNRRLCHGLCLGVCNRLVGKLLALPAVIAIHRIVAAADCRNLADTDLRRLFLHCLKIFRRTLGRHVASVEECVNPNLGQTLTLGKLKHAEEMVVMAVHAARRDQSHDVQCTAALLYTVYNREQCLVLEEITVLDVACDARELLIDNATRADIRVPDLGVAHLPVRQSDVLARGKDLIVFVCFLQPVDDRCIRHGDGVVLHIIRVAVAKAVHDDESDGRILKFCHNICFFLRAFAQYSGGADSSSLQRIRANLSIY